VTRLAFAALLGAMLWIGSGSMVHAQEQYEQNQNSPRPAPSDLAAEHAQGHRLYVAKCAMCHTLGRVMKKSDLSAEEWGDIVERMRNMAASHMNDAQAKAILDYLVWDDQQRNKKQESK
jgi:mono/diheme cytochrome c family protein